MTNWWEEEGRKKDKEKSEEINNDKLIKEEGT